MVGYGVLTHVLVRPMHESQKGERDKQQRCFSRPEISSCTRN